VIKTRRKRWAGHVAHLGEMRDIDGKIIIEWIFGNWVRKCGMDAYGSGQGPVAGCCEYGNKCPGSIQGGEFLD
jgi:hypothetical protein